MTAVIYARISLDLTGEGAGLERQEAECRRLAERLGLAVTRVYVDNDISATSDAVRPEFEQMLTESNDSAMQDVYSALTGLASLMTRGADAKNAG